MTYNIWKSTNFVSRYDLFQILKKCLLDRPPQNVATKSFTCSRCTTSRSFPLGYRSCIQLYRNYTFKRPHLLKKSRTSKTLRRRHHLHNWRVRDCHNPDANGHLVGRVGRAERDGKMNSGKGSGKTKKIKRNKFLKHMNYMNLYEFLQMLRSFVELSAPQHQACQGDFQSKRILIWKGNNPKGQATKFGNLPNRIGTLVDKRSDVKKTHKETLLNQPFLRAQTALICTLSSGRNVFHRLRFRFSDPGTLK